MNITDSLNDPEKSESQKTRKTFAVAHLQSKPKTVVSKKTSHEKIKWSVGFTAPVRNVQRAIRNSNVFEIRGLANPEVRECLLQRGWVEKQPNPVVFKPSKSVTPPSETSDGESTKLAHVPKPDIKEPFKLSKKLLAEHDANLIWCDSNLVKRAWKNWKDDSFFYINRHPQAEFASKKNIVDLIGNLPWVGFGRESEMTSINTSSHPRTYRLFVDEEKGAFVEDYKLTACMSLLKWFVHVIDKEQERNGQEEAGLVTQVKNKLKSTTPVDISSIVQAVDFALAQVKEYIRIRKHVDIDEETQKPPRFKNGINWDIFLDRFYEITHHANNNNVMLFGVALSGQEREKKYGEDQSQSQGQDERSKLMLKYTRAKQRLQQIKKFWPQFFVDGMRNVWIFKPSGGSQGVGILILDRYKQVAKTFLRNAPQHSSWLAQKYLERPLLISKAKFDLRQWFLIKSWNPLIAFIYKKSYIRFSTQAFSLDDLDESIHLTNHNIQTRYQVNPDRSKGFSLPQDNMWTSNEFRDYLKKIGKGFVWRKTIYPEMKKSILGILLASCESVSHRPGAFLIQGADFLITQDFQPWLLEINSNPSLAPSSNVKIKMTPGFIHDVFKVVLDWDGEESCDIGDFELLYQEPKPTSSFNLKRSNTNSHLVQGEKVEQLSKTSKDLNSLETKETDSFKSGDVQEATDFRRRPSKSKSIVDQPTQ